MQKEHAIQKRQEVQTVNTCQNEELPMLAKDANKEESLTKTNGQG